MPLDWGKPSRLSTLARNGCILRTVVGSQVHGLVRDGTDDRDEMAISIPPPEYAVGLHDFEHWTHRTQPEGKPSGPGDLDLVVYSLRKYCRLALKGSLTTFLPLFAPDEHVLVCTDLGQELRSMAQTFVASGGVGESAIGYLNAQRKALERDGSGQRVSREREVSARYGYDTKYAMHALRIGYQGLELLNEGTITLPMPEPERTRVMETRMGDASLASVLSELDRLTSALEVASLPGQEPPAELVIEQWLVRAYQDHWRDTWQPTALE